MNRTGRYRTQPVTFEEIKEVDEEVLEEEPCIPLDPNQTTLELRSDTTSEQTLPPPNKHSKRLTSQLPEISPTTENTASLSDDIDGSSVALLRAEKIATLPITTSPAMANVRCMDSSEMDRPTTDITSRQLSNETRPKLLRNLPEISRRSF